MTGQYCSPDPISLAGGDRPQGYVDRPGSWVDPLGLKAKFVNPNRGKDIDEIVAGGKGKKHSPDERYMITDKMNDKNFGKLVKDIKKNGLGDKDIIVVKSSDGTNNIVWGNNRFSAAKQTGKMEQLRFHETQLPFRGYRDMTDLTPVRPPVIRNRN